MKRNAGEKFVKKDLMLKVVLSFSFIFCGAASFAQLPDVTTADSSVTIVYIPRYEWSAGIEHSYMPAIYLDEGWYPDNFEMQGWISQRYYWEAGVFYIHPITEILQADSTLNLPQRIRSTSAYLEPGYTVYAGSTIKLYLFRNAYFTPSLNLYFEKYKNADQEWLITAGPTASFEYFIQNRFSIRADLFNFNIGAGSAGTLQITTHRVLGIGLRYNFDLRKQAE